MKKNKIIYIVLFLLVIVAYFTYKGFILYYYKVDSEAYNKVIDSLMIKETITVKRIEVDDNNYLSFNDIKIKNEFMDFKKLASEDNDSFVRYQLYSLDNVVTATFMMGTEETYIDKFLDNAILFKKSSFIPISTKLKDFFEENHITNDIELFKYLKKQENVKYNVFTSSKKIKENHAIKRMSAIFLPSGQETKVIDGDHTGFIFDFDNTIKEVSILKNNKRYVFTFFVIDYFTDDYIEQILKTIVIE